MSYTRVTWEDGSTALSAEHMNNIEEGIGEALLQAQGNSDMWSYIRNLVYPVGSIYMSATLDTVEKVAAALGGTWVQWGQGRVPVGVDTEQTEFDTAEETGGAKDVTLTAAQSGVPVHSHSHTNPSVTVPKHSHGFTQPSTPALTHSGSSGAMSGNSSISGTASFRLWGDGGGSPILGTSGDFSTDEASVSQALVFESGADKFPLARRLKINKSISHTHTINHTHAAASCTGGAVQEKAAFSATVSGGGVSDNSAANASSAHNNLQPYITCFMYKRTA